MTPYITDQDEREAIQYARNIMWWVEYDEKDDTDHVVVQVKIFRALLHRATRSHD